MTGLAGYFPASSMSMFSTGMGIAGVIMNGTRAMALAAFPDTKAGYIYGILVHYSVAGLFIFSCVVIHFKFVKMPYAKAKIGIEKNKNYHAFMGVAIPDEEEGIL